MSESKTFVKPSCSMENVDGNVFSIMGRADRALTRAGYAEKAKEMSAKIWNDAQDYNEALSIVQEYVEVVW